ncbi:hypothetical protein L873DRAFT_1847375 [Choiromyces venosus 120613-1]|uniref:Uncharacterized protein n=1 Tax=Choiromyces venosus 120613-1 TaxID=1336337 RepID=A0A3N4J9J6_9PEZI|nr:hypothetical protein L873DRAFT_1847375 [Choiromyces venosus 120613-1]
MVGPDSVLYYPTRPRISFHCQQEGHLHTHCPYLYENVPVAQTVDIGPDYPDHPIVRQDPPVKAHSGPQHAIKIAAKSSDLHGMKVPEVMTVEVDEVDLMRFVCEVSRSSNEDSDDNKEGEPVMAGEQAH